MKYRVIQGNFYLRNFDGTFDRFSKGDVVEVDDDNDLLRFKNKFEKIEEKKESIQNNNENGFRIEKDNEDIKDTDSEDKIKNNGRRKRN